MISIPHFATAYLQGGNQDGTYGLGPSIFWGRSVPDGDALPWSAMGVGSTYYYDDNAGTVRVYTKVNATSDDSDWSCNYGVLTETVDYADFTDGGAAVGTYTSTASIPIYATVVYSCVKNVAAFSGDTSCVVDIGDGTDDDRYTVGAAINIFSAADYLDGAGPQGTAYHSAAKSPVLTATSGSDWGAVSSAAQLTYQIVYRLP